MCITSVFPTVEPVYQQTELLWLTGTVLGTKDKCQILNWPDEAAETKGTGEGSKGSWKS